MDAIYEAEKIMGFEITTPELGDLAGGLDEPESVKELVTAEIVEDWLRHIEFAAK